MPTTRDSTSLVAVNPPSPGDIAVYVFTASIGPAARWLRLTSEKAIRSNAMETAHLSFHVEPAAMDRFTTALQEIDVRSGEVCLPAAD